MVEEEKNKQKIGRLPVGSAILDHSNAVNDYPEMKKEWTAEEGDGIGGRAKRSLSKAQSRNPLPF
jgi:hypothetical protein